MEISDSAITLGANCGNNPAIILVLIVVIILLLLCDDSAVIPSLYISIYMLFIYLVIIILHYVYECDFEYYGFVLAN